ncbi:hypothetical protein Neosp_013579 [[Neocosmospora] mangrovei]
MQCKDEPQTPTSDIANGSIIGRDVDWTPEEEAAVRRKFDFTITPNARIEGMSDELNLVGYRYNILLTVFFIFYLAYVA